MRGDEHARAAQNHRQDFLQIIGEHARGSVLEALASRRGLIIGATPDEHLLGTPFLARVILVEANQIAVVPLIERLILENGNIRLPQLFQHQRERALCADQRRRERHIEMQPLRLELLSGRMRFGDSLLAQVDISPPGEKILEIPFALPVANENKQMICRCGAGLHFRFN
jgi:hypothetical protein